MKLEDGDYLESNFIDSIRRLIPNYERIWGKYIGHDGNGKMIHIHQLSEDENSFRKKFAEALYTCMESIICIDSIAKETQTSKINTPDQYVSFLNSFMSFQAHSGRIRDNSKTLLDLFYSENKSNRLISCLEDAYKQRHQVVHGKKPPIRIKDSTILIAPIMGKEIDLRKWDSKLYWEDFTEENFEFSQDYLNKGVKEISSALNNILGNLIEPVYEKVKNENIDIDSISKSNSKPSKISGFQGPISGSTN